MPQRKQPRTLNEMSVEAYINIYYNVCNRWNLDLYNAMQTGRRHYRSVKRRVMSEIQQIKQILSEVAPLIQRIISPEIASSFAYSITFHYERNYYVTILGNFEEERHNLSLHSCKISPLNADTPLNPELPHFTKLLSLKIEKSIDDQTDFSFIRYYLNLERIELLGIDIFTEEFMEEVINLGTLANLKECYISETEEGALTLNVIEQLLRHCSNLKISGHTEQLDHLNSENVLQLKRELSEQNFDIDIIS
ncbi:hypothetical protein B7P43_G05440 [Cryptotermes secundus]|uniref:Uncharacterized protein n=1 Tax=Cryptotermes secundus TaxID=105785 RepID=A0A2J7QI81_9NEOP|nr:hypothetical protein B7P43_G05440 [Cryptotermes secundus]